MKVLILAHMFPSKARPISGTFSLARVKALSRYCEVKVVSFRFWFPFGRSIYTEAPGHDIIEGIEVFYPWVLGLPRFEITAWQSVLFFISYLISLRRIKRNFNFDLIHAYGVDLSGFAAVLLGRIFRRPIIVTGEGSDIHTFASYPLLGRLIRYTLRHCNHIITVSEALKDIIIRWGNTPLKITVVHNGVDLDKFKPREQIPIRQKLKLPLDKKIVLFVGTLRRTKGLLYLIPAIEQLAKKRKDFLFVLVGEGHLKQEIEMQVNKLGIEQYVRLVGPCRYQDVPEWMNACDIFCLPSLWEGFGVVLVEAAACGKPVVASRVGGIPETVVDGETGILVSPGNTEQLVQAIDYLIDNPQLCQRMGEAGRKRVIENYTWQCNAKKSIDIYEKTLSRFYHS